jgi:molecular chaperone DnaK
MLVHSTRKTISESGDKLDEGEKESIEACVKDLEAAIAEENIENIESATKALNDVLTPLTQKLYSQDGAETNPSEDAQTESTDNTVDAEYEEVKEEDKN